MTPGQYRDCRHGRSHHVHRSRRLRCTQASSRRRISGLSGQRRRCASLSTILTGLRGSVRFMPANMPVPDLLASRLTGVRDGPCACLDHGSSRGQCVCVSDLATDSRARSVIMTFASARPHRLLWFAQNRLQRSVVVARDYRRAIGAEPGQSFAVFRDIRLHRARSLLLGTHVRRRRDGTTPPAHERCAARSPRLC